MFEFASVGFYTLPVLPAFRTSDGCHHHMTRGSVQVFLYQNLAKGDTLLTLKSMYFEMPLLHDLL